MRMKFFLGVLVLTVALLLLGLANTKASTPSLPSLKGTCIWQEFKYPTTSNEGLGPASILASIHFDGSGAMTMDYDANVNGIYSSTNGVLATGSYSVDSTGHGSFGFQSPATHMFRTYDFRVSPNANTIYTMAKQDGTSVGDLGPTDRVSTGSCIFQEEDENRSDRHDSGFFSGR